LPKLRVGVGNIVDVKPLAWGFLKGHHADLFSTGSHPLGVAGRMLAQGALDVGLVPTVEAARYPQLQVLPDLCVSFTGEGEASRTLAVLSRSPFTDVRRLYLGRNSRSSAAALRIVMIETYGVRPEYLEGTPEGRLEPGEAVLLIGGCAFRPPEPRLGAIGDLHRLDLASAWRSLTGLPLVAGVWAVRRPPSTLPDLPDLPFYFKSSLRYGLSSIGAIARESAAELGVGSGELADYLRCQVRYFLQDEERRGIEELVGRSVAHGVLPKGSAIRFWSP
jgi:predicted solute-binding protein